MYTSHDLYFRSSINPNIVESGYNSYNEIPAIAKSFLGTECYFQLAAPVNIRGYTYT